MLHRRLGFEKVKEKRKEKEKRGSCEAAIGIGGNTLVILGHPLVKVKSVYTINC